MSFRHSLRDALVDGIGFDQRRRHRNLSATGFGVVIAMFIVGVLATRGGDAPDQTITTLEPTPLPTALAAATAQPAPATAGPEISERLPAPLVDPTTEVDAAPYPGLAMVGAVSVWTGEELIFWGGTNTFGREATAEAGNGAAYDPETRIWRSLSSAPGGLQSEALGVWSGSEVVICCGNDGDFSGSAVAYDPVLDTWRELPAPPFDGQVWGPSGLWVADRFWVLGRDQLLALDPSSDLWAEFQPPPVDLSFSPGPSMTAIGSAQLVVWPRPSARATGPGFVYDIATNTWSQLPDPPTEAWPAAPDVVWTGDELIVVGGLPGKTMEASERMVGARLDWASQQWSALPDVWPEPFGNEGNIASQSAIWAGDRMVVFGGHLGSGIDALDSAVLSYDPVADAWRRLPSVRGAGSSWNAPVFVLGDRVGSIVDGQLVISDGEWPGDLGDLVGEDGIPRVDRPPFVDLDRQAPAPLTLIASNGNPGEIAVIDLQHGLRTVYTADYLQLVPGPITDLAMIDRDLLLWRTDQPLHRYDGGPMPWSDADRLIFGELAYVAITAAPAAGERFVLAVPDTEFVWQVGAETDGRRVARLLDIGAGGEELARADLDPGSGPRGVSASGALVVSAASNSTSSAIGVDGSTTPLGVGEVVAISGEEVLRQQCGSETCERFWMHIATGERRALESSESRWVAVGGPSIPGTSAPLDATSPGGEQVLVGRRPVAQPSSDYALSDLVRVDVVTGELATVLLNGAPATTLATWSRTGAHVVVISDDGRVLIHDITTSETTSIDVVPEGFFVLAAA